MGSIHSLALFLLPLYLGPDQLLPLQSALAAVIGVLFIFWRRFVALVFRVWRLFKKD
jgi:hypothetical protein